MNVEVKAVRSTLRDMGWIAHPMWKDGESGFYGCLNSNLDRIEGKEEGWRWRNINDDPPYRGFWVAGSHTEPPRVTADLWDAATQRLNRDLYVNCPCNQQTEEA